MTREKAIEILKQRECCRECVADCSCDECENAFDMAIKALEQKIGHCKDCKWWKDSDGVYRRGVRAESRCLINSREVYAGNGYCYLFEPQESEE